VASEGVGREANQLDVSLGELGLELRKGTQLSLETRSVRLSTASHRGQQVSYGADGSEVIGVGEENDPGVANELVEINGTLGGLGLEVGRDAAQAEAGEAVST
jgi:hypothetical protein